MRSVAISDSDVSTDPEMCAAVVSWCLTRADAWRPAGARMPHLVTISSLSRSPGLSLRQAPNRPSAI